MESNAEFWETWSNQGAGEDKESKHHQVNLPHKLPLLHGKQFDLLNQAELEETLSNCLYCSRRIPGPEDRLRHINMEHYQEHNELIANHHFQILQNYSVGKSMNLTPLQHEAYLMAFFESMKKPIISPLNKIHNDVILNGQTISPSFFSMLLAMIQIRDDKFERILKILTRSCSLMHQNSPDLVNDFFQSRGFLVQFSIINKTSEELWQLRKQFPGQIHEWNVKQRQLLNFKTKLLHFLEKQFSHEWVKTFLEKAGLSLEVEEDGN